MAHTDKMLQQVSEDTKFRLMHDIIHKHLEIIETKVFKRLGECILE